MRRTLLLILAACNRDTEAPSATERDTDTGVLDAEPAPDLDGDGSPSDVDCDDADPAVYPGAPNVCGDDRVTDCNRTADTQWVTVAGTDSYEDLADALAAAAPDDEVLLCPGVYAGVFEAEEAVKIRAHGTVDETVLEGAGGTTLSVAPGSEVIGVTVRGGRSGGIGGGIRLTRTGNLRVEGARVTGNQADLGGGIGGAWGSLIELVDTVVEDNEAAGSGGGVWLDVGSTLDLSQGGVVTGNSAVESGGGVRIEDGLVVGGTVSENEARVAGGLHIGASVVQATVVTGNVAEYGGGMWVYAIDPSRLVDVVIDGNQAIVGGGLMCESDFVDLIVDGGAITSNVASDQGGGLATSAPVTLTDTAITDNVAPVGAGVVLWSDRTQMIGGSLLRNTASSDGGGLWLEGSSAFAASAVDLGADLDDNQPDDVYAGTAFLGYGSDATFTCDASSCDPVP